MAGSSSEDYLDKLLAGVTENSPANGEDDLDALLNQAEHPETVSEVSGKTVGFFDALAKDETAVSSESPDIATSSDSKEAAASVEVSKMQEEEAAPPEEKSAPVEKKSVAEAIRESLSEKKEEPSESTEAVLPEDQTENSAVAKADKPAVIEVSDEEAQDEAEDLLALLKDDSADNDTHDHSTDLDPLDDTDNEEGEDIEALLARAEAEGNASAKKDIEAIENADMDDLIGASLGDKELTALGDMLHKSDENVLLDKTIGVIPEEGGAGEETEAQEGNNKKEKKKKEKKEKKKKKKLFGKKSGEALGETQEENGSLSDVTLQDAAGDKNEETPVDSKTSEQEHSENKSADPAPLTGSSSTNENADDADPAEKKEKKPGFFKKLLNLLTEEVEDEEDGNGSDGTGSGIAEEGQLKLSDENKAILEAVDGEAEEGKGKKAKKEKKEKAPKEKKVKPKKEKIKKAKPEETEADKRKKLPKKYVTGNIFLAISIIVALLLINSYLPNIMLLREGREAFYEGDYQTAFLTMYGKDLNEGDQILYDKAKTIVILERKYESHQNYERMNLPYEALSVLFEGLEKYDKLLIKAESLGIEKELNVVKDKIVDELESQYGVSLAEAKEILTYSPVDYHARLESILYGTPFEKTQDRIFNEYGVGQSTDVTVVPTEGNNELPSFNDLLPEEADYLQQSSGEDILADEPADVLPEENTDGGATDETPDTNSDITGAGAQIGETPVSIQIESEIFE